MANIRVLSLGERDEILDYEAQKLAQRSDMDETARRLFSWHAKWRPEALEFYLGLGWSFGARDEHNQLCGYFLAQPLLFFRGLTQSLWIEHMVFDTPALHRELVDLAIRWGRDKHLQRVLFADIEVHTDLAQSFAMNRVLDGIGEVKTTKTG